MLLLWPRFLMVVFFVTMLFAYHALAAIEERECLRKFGQVYYDYLRRTPRFVPFNLPFRLPLAGRLCARPWPVRLLAGVLAYAAVLTLALGLAFALLAHSLRHLYRYQAGQAVYLALTPLDESELQQIVQAATADQRVRNSLDVAEKEGAGLINYVMPWEWGVPEIPMNEVSNHTTPGDYDRRRHKMVFTKTVLRSNTRARDIDILRYAVRTEPLAEAWIDEEGRVVRVLGPPGKTFYGTVPVPVF